MNQYNLAAYTYDQYGRILTETLFVNDDSDETMVKSYIYNAIGLVAEMNYDGAVNSENVKHYSYTYDKRGYITTEVAGDVTKNYTYDGIGRLTQASETKNNATTVSVYTYDSAGNRLSKTTGNKVTTYTYNGLNQLTGYVENEGNVTKETAAYTYTVNGAVATEQKITKVDTFSTPLHLYPRRRLDTDE